MIFELFTAFSSVVRGKTVLCLISSLLDSVLFTSFQTVVAGCEVFQSKTKQVFMIFLKKKPTCCHFADENTTFKTSIQPEKSL